MSKREMAAHEQENQVGQTSTMAGLSADVKKELVRKEARDGWQKGVVRMCAPGACMTSM